MGCPDRELLESGRCEGRWAHRRKPRTALETAWVVMSGTAPTGAGPRPSSPGRAAVARGCLAKSFCWMPGDASRSGGATKAEQAREYSHSAAKVMQRDC